MQVYIELALVENFCMDFTLLYAAKAVSKNPASTWRLLLGSVFGACFAVLFPLFRLSGAWAVVVKIVSGLVICVISGKFGGVKQFAKFCGFFFVLTALLGGALIGIFSLAGLDYKAGEGYMLSSVPIGIPLFGGLLLITGAKKLAERLKKTHKKNVVCRIYAGQSHVELKGFFDSGNKVYSGGAPVSVIPKSAAEKLACKSRIKDGVKIHTVAGTKTIGVFTADKMEINFGERTDTLFGVKIGVSPQRIDCAVLHCDLLEDLNV